MSETPEAYEKRRLSVQTIEPSEIEVVGDHMSLGVETKGPKPIGCAEHREPLYPGKRRWIRRVCTLKKKPYEVLANFFSSYSRFCM